MKVLPPKFVIADQATWPVSASKRTESESKRVRFVIRDSVRMKPEVSTVYCDFCI